jgi:Putative zinc finger motif, C2HC5-type
MCEFSENVVQKDVVSIN